MQFSWKRVWKTPDQPDTLVWAILLAPPTTRCSACSGDRWHTANPRRSEDASGSACHVCDGQVPQYGQGLALWYPLLAQGARLRTTPRRRPECIPCRPQYIVAGGGNRIAHTLVHVSFWLHVGNGLFRFQVYDGPPRPSKRGKTDGLGGPSYKKCRCLHLETEEPIISV